MNYRVQIRPLDCDQELGAGEWSAGVSERMMNRAHSDSLRINVFYPIS